MKKGFTLVELIIAIIIVGIIVIVAVPIYKEYIRRSYATEAMALIGTVSNAQKMYYMEYGYFANEGSVLDIDVNNNKFFTSFTIETE